MIRSANVIQRPGWSSQAHRNDERTGGDTRK